MIKDYAHIKKQPKAQPQKSKLPALMLLTAVTIGLLTMLAVQIHHYSKQRAQRRAQPTAINLPKQNQENTAEKKPTTHFEFYTLLSKQAVPQPLPHSDDKIDRNSSVSTASNKAPFYQLQAASLQNRMDAQTFARQLLTLGYQSAIQPYLHGDGTTWYRVVIGPIDNIASAKQMQSTLQQHHIDSLLTRIQ